MSGDFYYYVPGRKTVREADVAELQLGHAASGGPTFAATTRGPDGGAGVVFSWGAENLALAGHESVRWTKHSTLELWAGVRGVPSPTQFARKEQYDGHWVTFADGQRWLVPVARALSGASPLPKRVEWDGASWVAGDVLPRYRDLFSHAVRVWDMVRATVEDGNSGEFTLDDQCMIAALALAVNYRVGPLEITALGLFDSRAEGLAVLAMVDWPSVAQLKKSLASEELCSSPG